MVGFDELKLQHDVIAELRRLRSLEIVHLVDIVIVAKTKSGELVQVQASDLTQEESSQFGATAGELVASEG